MVTEITKRRMKYLYEKTAGICYLCGERMLELAETDIDHIVPKSAGGKNKTGNLMLVHRECNRRKGAKSINEYWEDLRSSVRKLTAREAREAKEGIKNPTETHFGRMRRGGEEEGLTEYQTYLLKLGLY